tara:strand:- start:2372 stop:2938 length:567 start_codon:yes stop_codon:yes gene_type:complete
LIVIIDNYDSFTYNLFQYVGEFYDDIMVLQNNDQKIKDISNARAFIFSPGPGKPSKSGCMPEIIQKYKGKIPMLGICLGHQAIIENFGGKVINSKQVCHGKVHQMKHFNNSIIFKDINVQFQATRYHSLIGDKVSFPGELEVTAISCDDQEIMGVQHEDYKIFGLQFHPESIETKDGIKMIKNFIEVI